MRSFPTLSAALMGLVFLSACGSASEGEEGEAQAPVEEPAADPAGMETEPVESAEISCWLLSATPEEAAQRPSPLGETLIELDGNVGKICYGRPSARGRVVEGGLIPFGQPWRMGADEATAIHLPFPARVGGIELEPGSYSIYAIADEFEWEFVLNRSVERWGIPIDQEVRAQDIGTFTGLPRTLTEPVEQFTIGWHTHGGDNGHLVLEWGTTRVEIEVLLLDQAAP